jgi:hypothetical protein
VDIFRALRECDIDGFKRFGTFDLIHDEMRQKKL